MKITKKLAMKRIYMKDVRYIVTYVRFIAYDILLFMIYCFIEVHSAQWSNLLLVAISKMQKQ